MAEKPNILIAVPAYRGDVKSECALSLMALASALTKAGISFTPIAPDSGDIETVRNAIASSALGRGFTHVFSTDNDMAFHPNVAMKMLRAKRDVIAAVCPLRMGQGKLVFSAEPYGDSRIEPDGTMRVSRIGTGIILISVHALQKLAATGTLRVDNTRKTGPIYGFFDRITQPDGSKLGEDKSFCDRWTACGGEIYAIIDEEIGHIDKMMHRGRFIEHLGWPTHTVGHGATGGD